MKRSQSLQWLMVALISASFAPMVKAAEPLSFSPRAEAIPFPPDAVDINFHDTFDLIRFNSGSSLAAVTDFYRRELPQRGWTEDKSAVEQDEDSIDMTFKHDAAQIVVELDANSSGVSAYFECEGLEFSGLNDPALLLAAGVPQPRSLLFLQKEIPRPDKIQDLEYSNDSCTFTSPLAFTELFDFYTQALSKAGWRETRKPLITADRRYTEYKKGIEEVAVNVFADETGSRIVLDYETETKEPVIPPLPDASQQPLVATMSKNSASQTPATAKPRVAVDVSKNTGSATFALNGLKQVFKHAAAYRAKNDGEEKTQLVFSVQPIPYQKLQDILAKEDSFSFYDIYPGSFPAHLTLSVGDSISFYYHSGGTTIGNSLAEPERDLKIDKQRIKGMVKMPQPQESFSDKFQIDFTIDAVLLTPETQLSPQTTLTK
ncbi:MAG: hypothetical protein SH868_09365 [Bythopirellula sp.]|nr:hypothetical protein [Bythopirellula sp.]